MQIVEEGTYAKRKCMQTGVNRGRRLISMRTTFPYIYL